MAKHNDDFLRELLSDFRLEAAEHLQSIVDGLLTLEKDVPSQLQKEIIETIFRATHSMKGAARAVNLIQIERLCSDMEGVFHAWKNEKLQPDKSVFDTLYQVAELLETMISEIEKPHKSISENKLSEIANSIRSIVEMKSPASWVDDDTGMKTDNTGLVDKHEDTYYFETEDLRRKEHVSDESSNETIRVASTKLMDILRMAGELSSVKNTLAHQVQTLQQIQTDFIRWHTKHDLRCKGELVDEQQASGPSGVESEFLAKHESKLMLLCHHFEQLQYDTSRTLEELIIGVKRTLMRPFSSLFAVVPKIVRDLSHEYGKQVSLHIRGGETEVDRRILEMMKDPVVHLIRNCIDHGIENPEQRRLENKSPEGSLHIEVVMNHGRQIVLAISDDGAGIDTEKLVQSAIHAGIIDASQVDMMTETQKAMLVFASGLTTSPFITDVSGRGLGMAIVAENISKIGGQIEVNTIRGEGTKFLITLPQSLSTFRGLLVDVSGQQFLLPTNSVVKALRVSLADIEIVGSKRCIPLGGEVLGLVYLSDVLGLSTRQHLSRSSVQTCLVIRNNRKTLVFCVDDILGEHEGVVRPLGRLLNHVDKIAGTFLLGDGTLVPVLQPDELLDAAAGQQLYENDRKNDVSGDISKSRKQVLVAEDSITIRNLLRSYLEAAGYIIKTAVNGQQAYDMLQSETFDALVSDIEMPGLNGFELTSMIRKNPDIAHLPVILVTALETPEDRKRGLDSGANAYIVKSSFDKGNLIEALQKLV